MAVLLNLTRILLAMLAWRAAIRDPRHARLAAYVTWLLASDLLRLILDQVRIGATKPYEGLARLAFHGDQLLFLSWSFLFLALCMHYFLRWSSSAALGALAATWIVCLNYPLISGEILMWIYRAVGIGTLILCWSCIVGALSRRREVEPSVVHLVLILFAAVDFVVYLVPFMGDVVSNWPIVRLVNTLATVAACAAYGLAMRRTRRYAR